MILLCGCTQAYYDKTASERALEELSTPEGESKYEYGVFSASLAVLTLGLVGDSEYDVIQAEMARLKEQERIEAAYKKEEELQIKALDEDEKKSVRVHKQIEESLQFDVDDPLYAAAEPKEDDVPPVEKLVLGQTTYAQVVELFGSPLYLMERLNKPKQARFKVKDFEYKYIPLLRKEPEFAMMMFDENDVLSSLKIE